MTTLPSAISHPLTHAEYAKDIAEAHKHGKKLRQFVQVNYHGAHVCGVIHDAWDTPEGREMWKIDLLEPLKGRMSFPAAQVRKCSGVDGRCHCHQN